MKIYTKTTHNQLIDMDPKIDIFLQLWGGDVPLLNGGGGGGRLNISIIGVLRQQYLNFDVLQYKLKYKTRAYFKITNTTERHEFYIIICVIQQIILISVRQIS